MNWLDTVLKSEAIGGAVTYRDCVKLQCGKAAVEYVEAAITGTTLAAFKVLEEHYVPREQYDNLLLTSQLDAALLQTLQQLLLAGHIAEASELLGAGTQKVIE